MPLEIELKYLGVDLDAVSAKLHALGGDFKGKRFESNAVFDDATRSLKERGILVRLRSDGRKLLTVKMPPTGPVPEGVKVWDERETSVEDLGTIEALLDVLGYFKAFCYEKVREEWAFEGCHVCLDHMPFGDFIELEGEPEAIRQCAKSLDLASLETSTENYHALNKAYRLENSLPPNDNFVFDPDERERLISENS